MTSLFEEAVAHSVRGRSYMPPCTNIDMPMDDVGPDESEAKTYEEKLNVEEASIYEDLLDLGRCYNYSFRNI